MNKYLLLSVTAGFSLLPHTAHALSARPISTEQLQGVRGRVVSLKLSPGYGLIINFLPVGERVVKAWLDDPSRITLSFDGELCQEQSRCTNTGANVVHLRQIKPINFPYITHSPTGETLLTLIAEGAQGERKLYQFTITPTSSPPEYTAINVVPETKYSPLHSQPKQPLPPPVKPNPRPERTNFQQLDNDNLAEDSNQKINPAQHSKTLPTPFSEKEKETQSLLFPTNIDFQLTDNTILRVAPEPAPPPPEQNRPSSNRLSSDPLTLANDLVYGLLIATQKGEIEYHSNTYLKIQNLILSLRRGQSLEASTSQALVKRKLVNQLLDWGQARPSSY